MALTSAIQIDLSLTSTCIGKGRCRDRSNIRLNKTINCAAASNAQPPSPPSTAAGTKQQQWNGVRSRNSRVSHSGAAAAPPTTVPLPRSGKKGKELEKAIAELERLFSFGVREKEGKGGPSHPTLGGGFSRRPVRVAYQGVRGSYCQEAAVKAFSSVCSTDFHPCDLMDDAFQALEDGSADRAFIPLENSIDGPIDRNFDLLLRHGNVHITGELILPVNHCLLASAGSSRSQLRRIVSHPQALSHCTSKLQALHLDIDEVPNSADAARYISENRITDTAVIGSKIAAREFGLQVLEQNLQDSTENFNRFLELQLGSETELSEPQLPQGKTTVAFSLENGVSDLFRALWLFESRNITVSRVEHRPNRSNPLRVVDNGCRSYLDYVFILDLEGRSSESAVQSGLACLKEISVFMRVLGSYTSSLMHP